MTGQSAYYKPVPEATFPMQAAKVKKTKTVTISATFEGVTKTFTVTLKP